MLREAGAQNIAKEILQAPCAQGERICDQQDIRQTEELKSKKGQKEMMIFGLIIPLLLIGLIAYALGWRLQLHQIGPAQSSQTPLEILKARYARGEITREEYEQLRHDVES